MVYGYVRVSTTGQVPGTSLQEQASQILQKYPTAEITEEAASGAHERPKFDALCNTLTAGDVLVVCKMDRFCRTVKEGLTYVDALREKNVSIHKFWTVRQAVIDQPCCASRGTEFLLQKLKHTRRPNHADANSSAIDKLDQKIQKLAAAVALSIGDIL